MGGTPRTLRTSWATSVASRWRAEQARVAPKAATAERATPDHREAQVLGVVRTATRRSGARLGCRCRIGRALHLPFDGAVLRCVLGYWLPVWQAPVDAASVTVVDNVADAPSAPTGLTPAAGTLRRHRCRRHHARRHLRHAWRRHRLTGRCGDVAQDRRRRRPPLLERHPTSHRRSPVYLTPSTHSG